MAFAAAGEKKIDPDDAGQVESLGHDEERLRQTIERFRIEELRSIATLDWPVTPKKPRFADCSRC